MNRISALYACAGSGLIWLCSMHCVAEEASSIETPASIITAGYFSVPSIYGPWLHHEISGFEAAFADCHVHRVAFIRPARKEQPIQDISALPNVFCMDTERGGELAWLVQRGLIVPIDSNEFSLADHSAESLRAAQFGGKTWGAPWIGSTLHLVYRPDDFEEVGLARPPETWDEFLEYCGLLARPSGDGKYRRFGCVLNWSDETVPLCFLSLLLQNQGQVIKGNKCHLDVSAVKKALATMRSIRTSPDVATTGDDPSRVFAQGFPSASMYLVTTRTLAYISRIHDLRLAIAKLPDFERGRGISASEYRLYLAIRTALPEEESAARKLVQWLTRPDAIPPYFGQYSSGRDAPLPGESTVFINHEEVYHATRRAVDFSDGAPHRLDCMKRLWANLEPCIVDDRRIEAVVKRTVDELNTLFNQSE